MHPTSTSAPTAPRTRALLLVVSAASVLLLHAVHVALVELAGVPGDTAVVVASGAVWLAVLLWQVVRWSVVTEVETVAAFCAGAAALTADGVWSGSPLHPALVAVGLTGIALGVVAFGTGRVAVAGAAVVVGFQVVGLLLAQGGSLLSWYVAVSTAGVTSAVCLAYAGVQHQLQRSLLELAAVARQDPLTRLLNRRGLVEGFPALRAGAPAGQRVALVLVDVDRFKTVNDLHGHDTGDHVLVAVADLMRAAARSGDLLSRQGGEELAWVCTAPDAASAVAAAERLRTAVAGAPMPHGEPLTISAGVAFATDATQTAGDDEALSRLLVRADTALYEAKRTGRDRVVLSDGRLPDGRDGHHRHAADSAPLAPAAATATAAPLP